MSASQWGEGTWVCLQLGLGWAMWPLVPHIFSLISRNKVRHMQIFQWYATARLFGPLWRSSELSPLKHCSCLCSCFISATDGKFLTRRGSVSFIFIGYRDEPRLLHEWGLCWGLNLKKFGFLEDNEPLKVAGDGGKRWQGYSRKKGQCHAAEDFTSPMLTVMPNSMLIYRVLL